MLRWLKLPTTATAPFCPSEVKGSIAVSSRAPVWKKIFQFLGPGLLISVGYMDPGNWATDIESGSRYGYDLLFIVLISSLVAIMLQYLSLKLGIATGKDLAVLSHEQFPKKSNLVLWALAELAIIACDLAEVLGSALAFKLLFGCSLMFGIVLTSFDTLLVLGLKGKGFRQVEAIVLGLVTTIGLCYFVELWLIKPDWSMVAHGFLPTRNLVEKSEMWYLAIGILGATVMPHNLYLHSSLVQTRSTGGSDPEKRNAIRYSSIDTIVSLLLALLVNAAILILASSAFHKIGQTHVAEIQDAYHLLDPVVGTGIAGLLFAIALLASGQSSTFTGTIAGQVIMEGYLNLKIPCWQRRIITRGLALIPAFIGVWILGDDSTGRLLVLSQVVLSMQLPFALYPLIKFTGSRKLMGSFANTKVTALIAWTLFGVISAANIWLVLSVLK